MTIVKFRCHFSNAWFKGRLQYTVHITRILFVSRWESHCLTTCDDVSFIIAVAQWHSKPKDNLATKQFDSSKPNPWALAPMVLSTRLSCQKRTKKKTRKRTNICQKRARKRAQKKNDLIKQSKKHLRSKNVHHAQCSEVHPLCMAV